MKIQQIIKQQEKRRIINKCLKSIKKEIFDTSNLFD